MENLEPIEIEEGETYTSTLQGIMTHALASWDALALGPHPHLSMENMQPPTAPYAQFTPILKNFRRNCPLPFHVTKLDSNPISILEKNSPRRVPCRPPLLMTIPVHPVPPLVDLTVEPEPR